MNLYRRCKAAQIWLGLATQILKDASLKSWEAGPNLVADTEKEIASELHMDDFNPTGPELHVTALVYFVRSQLKKKLKVIGG